MKTKYVVLERGDRVTDEDEETVTTEEVWVPVGFFEATDQKAAMRQAAEGRNTPVTLVAIPDRSWQPTPVTFATRVSFKAGEAE